MELYVAYDITTTYSSYRNSRTQDNTLYYIYMYIYIYRAQSVACWILISTGCGLEPHCAENLNVTIRAIN